MVALQPSSPSNVIPSAEALLRAPTEVSRTVLLRCGSMLRRSTRLIRLHSDQFPYNVREYKSAKNKLFYWTGIRSSAHMVGFKRMGPTCS